MARYAITFARSARRELEALPVEWASRLFSRIESLAEEPRPRGARKLQGSGGLWRVRVGEYRIVYEINDRLRSVDVVVVRHRRDAYR